VAHHSEDRPIKVETADEADIGMVVVSCQSRLSSMRERHAKTPPDGFIVFDEAGNERRRWFGSSRK
jgi:hypothetical protein